MEGRREGWRVTLRESYRNQSVSGRWCVMRQGTTEKVGAGSFKPHKTRMTSRELLLVTRGIRPIVCQHHRNLCPSSPQPSREPSCCEAANLVVGESNELGGPECQRGGPCASREGGQGAVDVLLARSAAVHNLHTLTLPLR